MRLRSKVELLVDEASRLRVITGPIFILVLVIDIEVGENNTSFLKVLSKR